MELRESILEAALEVFNQKGLKFTMDDIAKNLSISKKTIYTVFHDKEELFFALVDYLFDAVKDAEAMIVNDDSLDTISKIKEILRVMPDSYKDVDFRQLYLLKDKYPAIYKQVEIRLETGWENTIALINQGMKEGVIRPVSIPIVKLMMEAALEQFFQRDILVANKITYKEGLDEVVDIIMGGITQ